ncbi:hypothetical protein [Streptomyces sp. NPDC048560]|uniref:hypothetical protein n=1 Tax=Streptomyces sp. NPDC048560 TaxID=3155488 RepID=UPI003430FF45
MASPRPRAALRRLPAHAAVLPVLLAGAVLGPLAGGPATAAVHAPQVPRPAHATLAETGGTGERLWLLGGLGLALTGAGAVARAASRGRGRERDHG